MSWPALFRCVYETYRGSAFNVGQWSVIQAPCAECLHVVAGPGTGKTTSMVARILKLVFYDRIPPGAIVATTFTKKAAEELRSRLLSQGTDLRQLLLANAAVPPSAKEWIIQVDINQVLTGTLDSICQDILRETKPPGSADPEPVDAYVASSVMFRDGLLFSGQTKNTDLSEFLKPFHGPNSWGFHAGRKSKLIEEIYQRVSNDQINFPAFALTGSPSEQTAKSIVQTVMDRYRTKLTEIGAIDFVQLEAEVLQRFRAGDLDAWRDRLRVLIVDEYQDTNLLQEQIYLEMAQSCRVMSVVGDDDQSLYRFRGSTVELFVDFPTRFHAKHGVMASTHFLRENYRSTMPLIELVNSYASLDPSYQTVRVPPPTGGARGVVCQSSLQPVFPVLGMFRQTREELAEHLAGFLHDVFRGNGRNIPGHGMLVRDPVRGDLGDCCLLGSSHQEFTGGDRVRLPHLLRQNLEGLTPSIEVFNPRGRSLADIEQVMIFGGYLAHVVDPTDTKLTASAIGRFDSDTFDVIQGWKDAAADHHAHAATPQVLKDYVQSWFDRAPRAGKSWPRRISFIEFMNGLRHFFPFFRDDPEGVLYYEVFTRQFQACQRIGSWNADLVVDPAHPNREERSAFDLFEFLLGPIASGAVGVNEELIESFPRNRLSIMSIHQAKGLEFPMVIVDIGSDFTTDHPAQRRDRFPEDGESCHRLETQMRAHSPSLQVPLRSEKDRAFDDLYRKYFVAFSRPEQVLLLVGLAKSHPHGGSLNNIAAGSIRNGRRQWPSSVPITYL